MCHSGGNWLGVVAFGSLGWDVWEDLVGGTTAGSWDVRIPGHAVWLSFPWIKWRQNSSGFHEWSMWEDGSASRKVLCVHLPARPAQSWLPVPARERAPPGSASSTVLTLGCSALILPRLSPASSPSPPPSGSELLQGRNWPEELVYHRCRECWMNEQMKMKLRNHWFFFSFGGVGFLKH